MFKKCENFDNLSIIYNNPQKHIIFDFEGVQFQFEKFDVNEELMEIITWKQLSLYSKPLIIFNINHFYDDLLKQLNHCINERFMKHSHQSLWHVASTVQEVVDFINNYDENSPNAVESKL